MTKNSAASQAYLLYAALFVLSCCISTANGTNINIINKCSFSVTVYRLQKSPFVTQQFPLAPGDSTTVNVDQKTKNSIWASSSNNANFLQATVLDININAIGGFDFYDISNVNAYNLPTQIQPLGRPACKAPSCTIKNPAGFCKPPNKYVSAGRNIGEYCINTAGLERVPTAGTQAFKARCPDAFSYFTDAKAAVTCRTGGEYNFVYCP